MTRAIGNRPIGEIEARELLAALRPIEKRGAHDVAHRILQVCGQVFRYGIATDRCQRDISRDLEARDANPRRWTRHTRNWTPIAAVTLNPERDAVINAAAGSESIEKHAA